MSETNAAAMDATNQGQQPPKLAASHEKPWLKTYEKHGLNYNIELPGDDVTLINIFEKNFEKYGNEDAFVCMGAKMTFRELDIYSRQVAAYLQGLGLRKGDNVAVMMPNILQYPVCMIGILRAGLTLVNVNPLYTSHELEHQLQDSQAKALFIIENFAKTYQDIGKPLIEHVIVCSMGDLMGPVKGFIVNSVVKYVKKMIPAWHIAGHVTFKQVLQKSSASQYQRPTDITADDIAVLQYTGGTTGVAKGAMLTHKNLVANLYQCLEYIRTMFKPEEARGEYLVVALPLYHIFSFTACALLGMNMGFIGLLIPNPRDFKTFVKELGKYQPIFFPAVNTLFNGLAHDPGFRALDHSKLRLSLGGGMSVLPSTASEWERITNTTIVEGYGLSETSPVATLNPPAAEFSGKIGIPMPLTDIKLVDDNGNEVAQGERGEIAIKGPQVMKGYWLRPEATTETMTADGYFKSGDIAIMDENGFFKIVDRKKDMILVSGFNVYPNEIEEVLAAHPKVLEVGVIGIPDDRSGEVPKAYVVRKDSTLSEKELLDYARKELTGYKRPRHIKFVEELPKSNVGKILRKEIRKLEEQEQASN
jgi:long-chain acyl-CoA synthetase